MKRARFFIAVAVVLSIAVALRVPKLGMRPMHADEAVQAFRFRDLWEHHRYLYNPDEFHGPTLAYATYPIVWMSGARTFAETTKATYRMVAVLFGVLGVMLIVTFSVPFGKRAALWAALFAAVSPALVFYSRYYIHEMLLAVFSLGAMLLVARYWKQPTAAAALGLGICIGLMQATKETAAISYLAALLAYAATRVWQWRTGENSSSSPTVAASPSNSVYSRRRLLRHGVLTATVAVAVASLFLSSFGTNLRGPIDGVRTYLPWLHRAGGASPHIHGWYFYLQRLIWWHPQHSWPWSEAMIALFGTVGLIAIMRPPFSRSDPAGRWFGRWFGIYTVLLTILYCAIPYKTPWCLVQFWLGWIVLAGVGAARLTERERSFLGRWAVMIVLMVGSEILGAEAYYASYIRVASRQNPYLYAQTSFGVETLSKEVGTVAAVTSEPRRMRVQVIWNDAFYWPLPWYLRQYDRTEYWQNIPAQLNAPIIVAAPQFDRVLTERLGREYIMVGYYELRPQVLMQLWVRFDLWEAVLKRLKRI